MGQFDINKVLKLQKLKSELELEEASSLYSRLRVLAKDDPTIENVRDHLASLIEAYEEEHWTDEDAITDEQVKASDSAEKIVAAQSKFVQERKRLIRAELKKHELNQSDLAMMLGHRKNYMSELINGVRPFSKEDIVIINRLLGIPFENLIDKVIKETVVDRLKKVLKDLNKPDIKLREDDLTYV